MMQMEPIFGCGFEVFGRVQGVRMRKQTCELANMNGVRGWVMNTDNGTVIGQLEGTLPKVNELKFWLLNFGSPRAIIERAVFTPTKEITAHTYKGFTIRYHDDRNSTNRP
ncbi:acylphosphatase-2 [Scaptodrosophila lebanonensis]|uniref:Acylphosphatase n=1 Tax=Drosophila lebanonensis TaxID=7225 RepID=A0A6J2TA93_DROLE|nr:acylphosphatase-2 [Scaptodrosophila lebanonensis]